ncbi:hypothetical protein [Nocardia donostiensis]|uniref:hypothetical protein n=1 Tax=Nocardia donostiensis TaxID=1538463 RepID=UPI001C376A01|nr:hypothetical protein [Nocardia donostiensis]
MDVQPQAPMVQPQIIDTKPIADPAGYHSAGDNAVLAATPIADHPGLAATDSGLSSGLLPGVAFAETHHPVGLGVGDTLI